MARRDAPRDKRRPRCRVVRRSGSGAGVPAPRRSPVAAKCLHPTAGRRAGRRPGPRRVRDSRLGGR